MSRFKGTPFYPARRSPVLAKQMVATSQPLAAQVGLQTLLQGGNAADAAVATAAMLTVVEPTMNGLGSDAFAIVSNDGELYGLNASGKSPAAWSPARFAGLSEMPSLGWESITIPGAVSGWVELSKRFGVLPFEQLLQPAVRFAREGFHVSPIVAKQWHAQASNLINQPGFKSTFLIDGKPPREGDLFKNPQQSKTLEQIALTIGKSFYCGDIAKKIVADCQAHGGAMEMADFTHHKATWVKPISIEYRGYTIHELPPNGQGISALVALGILNHFDLAAMGEKSADSIHVQIEAMKLAFADTYSFVSDLNTMPFDYKLMLDRNYLKKRYESIDMYKASTFLAGNPVSSDTVYLTTADKNGLMVSFIQSNYKGFGSGVVAKNTGVSLQNRGSGFSLKSGHPNLVAGAKRPFHTIIPGFVSSKNKPFMSFGVMGGDMQPQGHIQMIIKTMDFKHDVQQAADAPRWKITQNGEIIMEEGIPVSIMEDLVHRGHNIKVLPYGSLEFGATQLIRRLEAGYIGGSESRRDGLVAGY